VPICNRVEGVPVPIPILSFTESTNKVLLSKLTEPLITGAVSVLFVRVCVPVRVT
jgi:hypothetical protein